MRHPVSNLAKWKALRRLAHSWGPLCLTAAVLPGGIVLVPLLFLFRRCKPALQAAAIRSLTPFDHA
jgi:hypothetical protein